MRRLDLSGQPDIFHSAFLGKLSFTYLSYLNVSYCQIVNISHSLVRLRNLLSLDISHNRLKSVNTKMFENQVKLSVLILVGNIDILSIESDAFYRLPSLSILRMSYQRIQVISERSFNTLQLEYLDLSGTVIYDLQDGAFESVEIKYLHLNGSQIHFFGQDMFKGVTGLNQLVTSAYKFCCLRPSTLSEDNCLPHQDEFSSCADLMRNEVLRSLVWIIGLFSLLGNASSLVYRIVYDRERLKLGYGIFVSNLAVADFLMGFYLIIIASADAFLRGNYITHDETWRTSGWCKFAGVLSTLSSEASVFFIFWITVDRFLVIKYPFGQVRFTTKYAITASVISWFIAIGISIIPFLITSYFKDSFYSNSPVCLALPLTRNKAPGWIYAVGVFIGFNFVTFLLIAFGQVAIYNEIKLSRKNLQGKRKKAVIDSKKGIKGRSGDLRIARNLLLVASTDFLCWFPIGVLGT